MDGTRSIDEDAFEALLAGRTAPAQAAPLQVFTLAVRAASAPQGRASAELAELIATGRLTDPEPSARTASRATGPARTQAPAPPTRRRPTMLITHAITAALAKVAAAGTIAQATAGVVLVAAGVTGAGAAGALPAPAQDRFGAVVQQLVPGSAPAATDSTDATDASDTSAAEGTTSEDDPTSAPTGVPTTSPTSTGATTGKATGTTTGTTDPTSAPTDGAGSDDGAPTPAADPTTAVTPRGFGSTVSADARDGGVDGQAISQQARARAQARATARSASPEPSTSTTASTPATGRADGHGQRASSAPTAGTPEPSVTGAGHSHS